MRVGKFLGLIAVLLAVLSGLAYLLRPHGDQQDKIVLAWASDDNPTRADTIDAFNRENPNLYLYLDPQNAGWPKVVRQSASGIGPDLFDFVDHELQSYVEAGILWDVTDAAAEQGFSVHRQGWPAGVELSLLSGRQYGFYCNIGAPILIYNKNVFDFFGAPYPTDLITWDEFLSLAIKVNAPYEEEGKQLFALAEPIWSIYFDSLGGEFFTEAGLLDVRSANLRQAFQWQKNLLKHKLLPTISERSAMIGRGGFGMGVLNEFASGDFAMLLTGDWTLIAFTQAYIHQLEHRSNGNGSAARLHPTERPLRLGAALIPRFLGKEPRYRVTARMAGINRHSPRRAEALKVLHYFAGPTYSFLINKNMDWLPGNPEFADLGIEEKFPDLSRIEMHRSTVRAMTFGYVQRRSPFFLQNEVRTVLNRHYLRMEENVSADVDELLASAEEELLALLRRRLARDPQLRKLYDERVATAARE